MVRSRDAAYVTPHYRPFLRASRISAVSKMPRAISGRAFTSSSKCDMLLKHCGEAKHGGSKSADLGYAIVYRSTSLGDINEAGSNSGGVDACVCGVLALSGVNVVLSGDNRGNGAKSDVCEDGDTLLSECLACLAGGRDVGAIEGQHEGIQAGIGLLYVTTVRVGLCACATFEGVSYMAMVQVVLSAYGVLGDI